MDFCFPGHAVEVKGASDLGHAIVVHERQGRVQVLLLRRVDLRRGRGVRGDGQGARGVCGLQGAAFAFGCGFGWGWTERNWIGTWCGAWVVSTRKTAAGCRCGGRGAGVDAGLGAGAGFGFRGPGSGEWGQVTPRAFPRPLYLKRRGWSDSAYLFRVCRLSGFFTEATRFNPATRRVSKIWASRKL